MIEEEVVLFELHGLDFKKRTGNSEPVPVRFELHHYDMAAVWQLRAAVDDIRSGR